jgi:cytochrome P450
MMIEKLPFAQPGAYEPAPLADFYQKLYESGQRTFFDKTIGMQVVWHHSDVQRILDGSDPHVGNENSLNPLNRIADFKLTRETLGGFLALGHITKPATANAHGPDHAAVKDAVFDPEHSYSLNRRRTESNYRRVVGDKIDDAATHLQNELSQNDVVDLSTAFIRPVVSGIIGTVIGFGAEQHGDIQQWSEAQAALLGQKIPKEKQGAAVHGLAGLAVACHDLIKDRKRNPGRDLASVLASDRHELSFKLAGSAAMNLIAAGYATTHNTIGNIMRFLSTEEGREHWVRMADSDYAARITPELVRVETGLIGWKRQANHAVTLTDGQTKIPKGRQILTLLGAANRDPEAFRDPDAIRFNRPTHPMPVSFGIGPHLCMGKELALMEIRESLITLRRRFPTLKTAEDNVIEYEPDYLFRAPRTLPVRLG